MVETKPVFKQVFEGYLCHTRQSEESYGPDFVLSDRKPLELEVDHYTGDWKEKITVPPTSENVVFNESCLFDDCDFGKKYRVTIEEICQK